MNIYILEWIRLNVYKLINVKMNKIYREYVWDWIRIRVNLKCYWYEEKLKPAKIENLNKYQKLLS